MFWCSPQIREQMSGPDLHVFTLKFLALKKVFFSCFRGQKKFKIFFYKKGIMQLFSADAIVFKKNKIFDPKNMKKPPSKVAHNRPKHCTFLHLNEWWMALPLNKKNGALQCITKITFSNLLRKFGREVLIEWSQIVQLASMHFLRYNQFDYKTW